MKTILIIKDTRGASHLVDTLVIAWKRAGYRVVEHFGFSNPPPADLLFLHVDKTILPEEYLQCTASYQTVINGRVTDISRRRYSTILLNSESLHTGPVIVKTNANYGGIPEFVGTGKESFSWERTSVLNPRSYPIFAGVCDVPAGVWKNPRLVVEKFIPEFQDGYFYVRYWTFLGEANLTGRIGSRHPIVKFSHCETPDTPVAIPDRLRIVRKNLGLDYGRFDFVVHGDYFYLLDVNKTQGGVASPDTYRDQLNFLASGIKSFLQ